GHTSRQQSRCIKLQDAPRDILHCESVLMRGIFKVGKKSHDVLLTRTRLTWTAIIPESPTGHTHHGINDKSVLLQDVFAVKVKRRRMAGQQSGGAVLGLALFHSRRRGQRLEEDTLHLHNASAEHTHSWYNTLKELLTVTDRKGHALSVMKECKLDEYDGVVCVGGDGSVAELCHALVLRAQLDADSPENPVRAALPLGIIPAGKTFSCSRNAAGPAGSFRSFHFCLDRFYRCGFLFSPWSQRSSHSSSPRCSRYGPFVSNSDQVRLYRWIVFFFQLLHTV
uniref:DAGKc domain-containing protein n=1 Tax=Poecilia mexicana TaxID=48701 RepID=A0A3B3WUT1_9TELE